MHDLTSADWDLVRTSPQPVLVFFWAPWCNPWCTTEALLMPFVAHFAGKAVFARVNADEEPELIARFAVSHLPALLLFHAGELAFRFLPAHSPAEWARQIYRHLGR